MCVSADSLDSHHGSKMSSEKTPLLHSSNATVTSGGASASSGGVSSNEAHGGGARGYGAIESEHEHSTTTHVHIDDDVEDDCDPSTVADVEGALGHAVEEATGESLVLVEKSKKVSFSKKSKEKKKKIQILFFFFSSALCRWLWWQNN